MKKTKAMQSLLYSGDLLAVDLGTFAVKILHLKAKERSLTVLGSARREVWGPLADAKSEEDRTEIYARALRELLAAHRFKTRNASISLAGNLVIVRFLALPAGFTLDPETGLPAGARSLIPFDEPDPAVSALVLDGAKGGKQPPAEMMLAAAQKKTVQGGMDVVRKAGLRPAVIVNDVLALANAYEFFQGKKTEETIVLVNAGATSTSVSVLENGVTKAARIFNIAGNTFTRAVKKEFAVDFAEAEKLKIAHGLSAREGMTAQEAAAAARVVRALGPAVKDLSGEIQRTVDVFLERRPADYPPIRRIVLAGGSAVLRGLSERLAADAGMPVEVFCPMVNVTAKDGGIGLAPLGADLGVPCGLALSNTILARSLKSRINLIPRKARRAAMIRDAAPGLLRLIVGPALVVLALAAFGVWHRKVAQKEAALQQSLAAAAKAESELQRKFAQKPKTAVVVKRAADPFAYLGRLTVSGVLGDKRAYLVMLNGGYVARGGKLFDGNEEEVTGVTSKIRDNSLDLTVGGRRYLIDLPQ